MNEQDYIRKAVELADGWETTRNDGFILPSWSANSWAYPHVPQHILDALAAQLVRQVDATTGFYLSIATKQKRRFLFWELEKTTYVFQEEGQLEKVVSWSASGPDRTMNTIKAIVDSGVLE